MKTITQFFPLMITVCVVGLAGQAGAQGRGHDKEKDEHRTSHHHKRDYDRDGHHHVKHKHVHKHDRRADQVRYASHYHDRYCRHTPVAVRQYHERPRYVYYRDYDVYFDTRRSVYISWSGKNWSANANVPLVLHRVDRHKAIQMEVDYYQDDFVAYLESGRPVYRSAYTKF